MPKVSATYLEERRQQILDAAIACFSRKGFHQTTMEDIGREAGLSPGVAYRYFSSKEDIIQAAAADDYGSEERVARFNEDMETYDFPHVLDFMVRYVFERFKRPGTDTVMKVRLQSWAGALQNPQVQQTVLDRWDNRLAINEKIVRLGQQHGRIDPDLDPLALARVFQAILDGITLQWTLDPNADIEKCRDVIMALFGSSSSGREQKQAD